MAWKYVMLHLDDLGMDFPIIFPDKLVHKDVALWMTDLMKRTFKTEKVSTLSAGKVEHIIPSDMGGKSDTLGLESNPMDEYVVLTYSYTHGVSGMSAATLRNIGDMIKAKKGA